MKSWGWRRCHTSAPRRGALGRRSLISSQLMTMPMLIGRAVCLPRCQSSRHRFEAASFIHAYCSLIQVGNPLGMEGLGLEGLSTPPRLMTPEPHMAPRLTTPDPDEDQEDGGSEQSEGSSSGKENDGEPPTLWRGSRGSLTSRGSR